MATNIAGDSSGIIFYDPNKPKTTTVNKSSISTVTIKDLDPNNDMLAHLNAKAGMYIPSGQPQQMGGNEQVNFLEIIDDWNKKILSITKDPKYSKYIQILTVSEDILHESINAIIFDQNITEYLLEYSNDIVKSKTDVNIRLIGDKYSLDEPSFEIDDDGNIIEVMNLKELSSNLYSELANKIANKETVDPMEKRILSLFINSDNEEEHMAATARLYMDKLTHKVNRFNEIKKVVSTRLTEIAEAAANAAEENISVIDENDNKETHIESPAETDGVETGMLNHPDGSMKSMLNNWVTTLKESPIDEDNTPDDIPDGWIPTSVKIAHSPLGDEAGSHYDPTLANLLANDGITDDIDMEELDEVDIFDDIPTSEYPVKKDTGTIKVTLSNKLTNIEYISKISAVITELNISSPALGSSLNVMFTTTMATFNDETNLENLYLTALNMKNNKQCLENGG